MGILRLIAKLFGASSASPETTKPVGRPQEAMPAPYVAAKRAEAVEVVSEDSGISISFTATYTGPALPDVSDTEVAEHARQYAFVMEKELASLKPPGQWWAEKTHKRRLADASPKAYDWLHPFLSRDLAQHAELHDALERGPAAIENVLKKIRALIRARRKEKAAFDDLLKELYGAAVLAHVYGSLQNCFTGQYRMTEFVAVDDLQDVRIEYPTLGYQCIETLGKTDVKWLIEVFGEPAEHQSFESLWPHVRRNAISRMCWNDMTDYSGSSRPRAELMQAWVNERIRIHLSYCKEWQDRVVAQKAQQAALSEGLDAAWAATNVPFVVADLETTGFSAGTDEILEFAAVQVSAAGAIDAEFSVLVRTSQPVPSSITRLTGITQDALDREGRPLAEAMKAFVSFAGSRPVFFHNAPFDTRFLKAATNATGVKFANPVHDTLPMARAAWPTLGSYKLSLLAEHVGAPAPTHRALADVRTTLAVLLSARRRELVAT